ncbi:thioredoxin family protein [Streptomyces chiangmaiensis]|uniref:Thioredoxin family protein n=1 Tax=Streptomyces chiangmaiensis TaxID=766497 RepID=A0ABU7FKJ6_9ACTN|nr:thioredoxin family protein [Streptomyces chiangmaiensis]MED7824642.1 thioredoxin family protein [Streptomyces chiangmaiensis]
MRRPLFPTTVRLAGIALLALTGCDGTRATSHTAPASVSSAPATESSAPSTPTASSESEKPAHGYDPQANATADITAALEAAKKDGRPVLVDFGADWCLDCRVLGARFAEPGPSAMLAKYHVVTVDVGEFDRNLDVAERYVNLQTSGIPALVVLDPASGRIKVATNRGEFAQARSMSAAQVEEFLKRWV